MSLLRALPPAGTPIGTGDLARWLRVALAPSPGAAHRAIRTLEVRVTERFGVRSAFLVGSGRTGLSLLLEEMARLRPGRVEVAVAGYTCYSVAAAIVRAGLRVRPLVAAQAMGAEVGGRAVGSFGDM